MKVLKVIFGVCLGVLAFYGANASGVDDVVRAATRRDAVNAVANTRGNASSSAQQKNNMARTNARERIAPARDSRDTTVKPGATRTAVSRQSATTASRTAGTNVSTRNVVAANTGRNISTAKNKTRTAIQRNPTRGVTRTATQRSATRGISRAATSETGVRATNYKQCREVYYECMDEFCANKDANLRRCACSSRHAEFDSVKKQLSDAEDKMLDFNQRLLMVNLDAKDVTASQTASAGENAFYLQADKTESQSTLDNIAKKLNSTFGDDSNRTSGTSLSAVSLSLDTDSAFDSVDSLMGANTTTKSGVALYNAALPVCREMAMEICTQEEFDLAVSGYQMQIEQDCNTVSKAYQSKVEQARTKIHESGALLDMSRLDAYQTRNSDDMITCKRKMLDILTDSTVCGANLAKCLDMTGKYIDPTTGTAFLTTSLSDLDGMIARPDAGQTWTSVNASSAFLTYLQNKKSFLVTATENCQNIADTVWEGFIEDALAKIKLAQTAKLEEIRQACTTLTAECLTSASESIAGFDSRALSVFGISATQTAISMCADIQNACTALIDADIGSNWGAGMTAANTAKTYESIISTCTQVGQNCIIQACKSVSGNFGLCEDIYYSANRHSILERVSCWNEVLDCVASAGDDTLTDLIRALSLSANSGHKYSLYQEIYDNDYSGPIYDICESDYCTSSNTNAECVKCRIAERIWGNCEAPTNEVLSTSDDSERNKIIEPKSTDYSTLLSWFAKNTGTTDNIENCKNTRCSSGIYAMNANNEYICILPSMNQEDLTNDGFYCPTENGNKQLQILPNIKNCCFGPGNNLGHKQMGDNQCCATGNLHDGMCLPTDINYDWVTLHNYANGNKLICFGSNRLGTHHGTNNPAFPNGEYVLCDGTFVLVTADNRYSEPTRSSDSITNYIQGPVLNAKTYYYNNNQHTTQTTAPSNATGWFVDIY